MACKWRSRAPMSGVEVEAVPRMHCRLQGAAFPYAVGKPIHLAFVTAGSNGVAVEGALLVI